MEHERRDSGPPLPPGPGGAYPVLVSIAIVVFLLAGLVTVHAVVDWVRPGGNDDPINMLFAGLAVFPLTVLVALQLDREGFDTLRGGLGLRPSRSATVILALLFGLAAVLPLAELDNILQGVFPLDEAERTALLKLYGYEDWTAHLAKVLALAVVTPIGEEIIFRGIVLRWLRRSYGRLAAVAVSSLLFAAAHLSLRNFLIILLLGIAFGWIADRARSVLPTICAHAAFNGVPLLILSQIADVPGFVPTADTSAAHLPTLWVVGSSAACIVLLYLIWWTTLRRN
jgi:membrane protease YdiL (CAAX protease family)